MNPDKEGGFTLPLFKPESLFNNLLNFEKKEVLSWKRAFSVVGSLLSTPCV